MDIQTAPDIIKSYSNKQSYRKSKSVYFEWENGARKYNIIEARNKLMSKLLNINILDNKTEDTDIQTYTADVKKNCKNKTLFKNKTELEDEKTNLLTDTLISDTSFTSDIDLSDEKIDNNRVVSEKDINDCFKWLQRLDWKDKDEVIMYKNRIVSNGYNLHNIYATLLYLAENLYNSIKKITGAVDAMNDEQKYNFLFHVIAKGRDMYYQSLVDPDFSLYMLDQYQPLYTFLLKELRQ